MSDEVERTLCQLPSVFVFKVPALRSAEGHRASDFPKESTWSGKLKIVAKGRQAAIILMDAKNQVFAVCPVTDGAVEKTVDSGRYFILRIQNAQGKHAYIGIAFNERNDAFDFNVALQEHKRELEREDQAHDWEAAAESTKDMSLKDGEKIKINIGGLGSARRDKKPVTSGGGGFLPPPKERAPGTAAPAPASAPAAAGTGHAFDPFGNTSSPATSSSSASSDPFAGSFGSSDPFASAPAAAVSSSGFSSDPFASSGGDPFAPSASGAPASSSSGNSLLDF